MTRPGFLFATALIAAAGAASCSTQSDDMAAGPTITQPIAGSTGMSSPPPGAGAAGQARNGVAGSAGKSPSQPPTAAAGGRAVGGGGAIAEGASGVAAVAGRSAAGASGGAAGHAGALAAAGSGGGSCTPPAPGTMGKNPLFSDTYTADPGAFVHDCTFYIQCGHDEGDTGFVMKEWYLLSSTDLVTWTKKVALDLKAFSWADSNAWAGQMVTKNGKFYWFVPVNERGSGMAIGVAVADSPTGPFKDAIGKALIDDAFEMSNVGFKTPSDTPFTIDPTVFVDDDGQAYLHYGGFGRMIVAKLGADMISIDGKMKEVTPKGFFEAAFLTKHGGKYYEIYAAGQNPATIDYASSTSPLGPWTYGGRVLDALPNVSGQDAATNHAGVAEFAGSWYIVYHLSNGPNGGGTYRREVAFDKLEWSDDGTIKKLTPSKGVSF